MTEDIRNEIYISYPRTGGGCHTENYARSLARKLRYRQRNRATLAAKQRRYRKRIAKEKS